MEAVLGAYPAARKGLQGNCRQLRRLDGSGAVDYPGAKREAELLAEYIKRECGGHLDCLYAESLGCCPAIYLKGDAGVQIENMILSGPECLDCGIFNGLVVKIVPKTQEKMLRNLKTPGYRFPWYLMRITGQTQKGMKKLARLYPKLETRCFEGYGHGEIIAHPQRLTEGLRELLENTLP